MDKGGGGYKGGALYKGDVCTRVGQGVAVISRPEKRVLLMEGWCLHKVGACRRFTAIYAPGTGRVIPQHEALLAERPSRPKKGEGCNHCLFVASLTRFGTDPLNSLQAPLSSVGRLYCIRYSQ